MRVTQPEETPNLHPPPSVSAYPRTDMDNFWLNALWSVAPTILVGLIFWLVMRSIIHADRTERKVYARIEAEERARLGLDKPVT